MAAQLHWESDPENPRTIALLALAQFRSGNVAEGFILYKRLSGSSRQLFGLDHIFASVSSRDAADRELEEAYKTGHRSAYMSAAKHLQIVNRRDPDDPYSVRTLAWVYLEKLHNPQAAYNTLRHIAYQSWADLELRKLYAIACFRTDRRREAEVLLRQVHNEDPTDNWISSNLGRVLSFAHAYRQAETVYDTILRVEPTNLDARLGLAEVAALSGRKTEAIHEYQKLRAEHPDNSDANARLGWLQLGRRELFEATRSFEDAILVAPGREEMRSEVNE